MEKRLPQLLGKQSCGRSLDKLRSWILVLEQLAGEWTVRVSSCKVEDEDDRVEWKDSAILPVCHAVGQSDQDRISHQTVFIRMGIQGSLRHGNLMSRGSSPRNTAESEHNRNLEL